jgi:predicted amidohydrolase
VFSNPVGWDYDTVKPGLSMILDPFGEVLVETNSLEDSIVVGLLTPDKLEQSSGHRYIKARRPELYDKLVEPQESITLPGWTMEHEKDSPV